MRCFLTFRMLYYWRLSRDNPILRTQINKYIINNIPWQTVTQLIESIALSLIMIMNTFSIALDFRFKNLFIMLLVWLFTFCLLVCWPLFFYVLKLAMTLNQIFPRGINAFKFPIDNKNSVYVELPGSVCFLELICTYIYIGIIIIMGSILRSPLAY